MRIKKVINNNILCVDATSKGAETDRDRHAGWGSAVRSAQRVDPAGVEKVIPHGGQVRASGGCGNWWSRSRWSTCDLTAGDLIAEIKAAIPQPLNE